MVTRRPLIPPGWEERHRPIVQSAMTAVCEIRGPQGDWDPTIGDHSPGEILATGVPCRVVGQGEGRVGQQISQPTDTRSLQISAPVDLVPDLDITDDGPILTVTGYLPGHAGDPHLVGKPLRVTNAQPGTILFERTLTATMEV